ncbi:MAG: hypothetical protein RMJ51_06725 [Candidatus Calescibacterium sp.]|nr:hypothetical protein [Candidatus Calescibacterium sp.]MDW8195909.1 hypothetical protein [Candidatus Calescibacterium sp.]
MVTFIQKAVQLLILSFLLLISNSFSNNSYYPIIILYNPDFYRKYGYSVLSFEQSLREEGVNFKTISVYSVLSDQSIIFDNKNLKGIILPDKINQYIPHDFYFIFQKLLQKRVNVFISYDVGIKDRNGRYLSKCIFSDILGLNYVTYEKYGNRAYLLDQVEILDPEFLGFPESRLDKGIIVGYKYPIKRYYVSNVEIKYKDYIELSKTKIYDLPFIVLKKYKNGTIYYVNTPLGYLKANSDDLILRINLKTFLYKVCKVNHILNLYYGIPTLIINYHVDSNSDFKAIEFMYNNGYLKRNIKSSFHITAGDFRDREGDKLGFEACGKGRKYVELLSKYGEIGSHGGWAHNYFSNTILYQSDKIDLKHFIKKYIKKNNECLQDIVGYNILEYSAPNGVYPQPINTKVLEEFGMICYYYVGDLGSQPNLTFYQNLMVSDKVLAFPVMPYKTIVSLGEMKKNRIPASEVKIFLKYLVDYVIKNDTVRLYYTHPYDILEYPQEYYYFIDYIDNLVSNFTLQTQTMKEYTEFFFRFLKTKYDLKNTSERFIIELNNPISLKGITLRIQKDELKNFYLNENYCNKKGVDIKYRNGYFYFIVKENVKYLLLVFRKKT